jgi:hypothetical protein
VEVQMKAVFVRSLLLMVVVATAVSHVAATTLDHRSSQAGQGTITGVVTDAITGQPLPGIEARYFYQTPSGGYTGGAVLTNNEGRYAITKEPGEYRIGFEDRNKTYATLWYDQARFPETATPVQLTAGATVVIDAELQPAGTISGIVAADESLRLSRMVGIEVYDINDPSRPAGYANADQQGAYTVGGLLPGSYKVLISAATPGTPFPQSSRAYYNLKARWSEAETVSVVGRQTTTVHPDLTNLGSISGVVRDQRNMPVDERFVVQAVNRDGQIMAETTTDTMGQYRLDYLTPGDYRVVFTGLVYYLQLSGCDKGCTPYERYEQQLSEEVTLARGQHISQVNGTVASQWQPLFLPVVTR